MYALHRIVSLATAAALFACGGGSEPTVPTTMELNLTSVSFAAIGQSRQLSVTVRDQHGDAIAHPSVTWTTSDSAVATVTPEGLIIARGKGSATVTASVGGVSAGAAVAVTQVPAQIQKTSGDAQTATPGQALPSPLMVQVHDSLGNPVAGETVTFTGSASAITIGSPSAITAADGQASTTVILELTGAQQVTATVSDPTLTAVFTETSVSPFNIELRFLTQPTAAQSQAFSSAKQRWESLLVGDLPGVTLDAPAGSCGTGSPALHQGVDDVIILVTLEPIDGPGAVLGQASPCFFRAPDGLTALGLMRFDTDDLAFLQTVDLLGPVILHEMGHVLGFGTLWPLQGLLADPAASGGTDPHFTGSQAIAAFNAVGGSTYSGLKVPVEATGGPGMADGHWRESVFGNELMTPLIAVGQNPLSRVTVASMADQGYKVNPSAADDYSLGAALQARGTVRTIHLHDDVMRIPMRAVDAAGRVTRVLTR